MRLFCRRSVFRVAVYIEHMQRLHNAVEHFRAANGRPGFLLRHLQLTGVIMPPAQIFDILTAGKFVTGYHLIRFLEHHRWIRLRPCDNDHDR